MSAVERILVHGRPPPALRGQVLSYEGYRERGVAPFVMREVPRGFAVVIIGFGPPFRVGLAERGLARAADHRSFFAGAHDRPAIVASTGGSYCLQINLTLPAATRVLGVPLRELTNRIVALDDVVGGAAELTERLWHAPDWETRFTLLNAWLASRLTAAAAPAADLEWAWDRLRQDGAPSVGRLAREIGCSRKHLTVRFHEAFGLPPSTAGQVLRFARTLGRLERDPRLGLAGLALDGGYSDQPHLNRAFQRFAGMSPTSYLRQRLPAPGGIAERR